MVAMVAAWTTADIEHALIRHSALLELGSLLGVTMGVSYFGKAFAFVIIKRRSGRTPNSS